MMAKVYLFSDTGSDFGHALRALLQRMEAPSDVVFDIDDLQTMLIGARVGVLLVAEFGEAAAVEKIKEFDKLVETMEAAEAPTDGKPN